MHVCKCNNQKLYIDYVMKQWEKRLINFWEYRAFYIIKLPHGNSQKVKSKIWTQNGGRDSKSINSLYSVLSCEIHKSPLGQLVIKCINLLLSSKIFTICSWSAGFDLSISKYWPGNDSLFTVIFKRYASCDSVLIIALPLQSQNGHLQKCWSLKKHLQYHPI